MIKMYIKGVGMTKFDATDNWQSYGTKKTFNLFEKEDTTINFNTEFTHEVMDDFNNNRILFTFSGTF